MHVKPDIPEVVNVCFTLPEMRQRHAGSYFWPHPSIQAELETDASFINLPSVGCALEAFT